MGGNHHHPFALRERADQPQHLLHLDEVEVRGRLVGQDQQRIQRDRASDRDALLLPAAQVARSVFHSFRKIDARQQFLGALDATSARDIPAARSGTITFSSAVRLGTRLNAWKTMPTLSRR